MTLIHAVILGIVEGITEFLPISSTAHLEIVGGILKISHTDFVKSFEIIIQLGAILAVVVLYWKLLIRNSAIWKRIIVAFIPTGIIGFILYKLIKTYILGNFTIISWTLLVGGIILIMFEYLYNKKHNTESSIHELEHMPYSTAFLIGCAQSIAVVPGVSRAAATIIAGRMLGVGKVAIVEFSFLLAIPTMMAAAGYDILKSHASFSSSDTLLLIIGFVTAFIAALISIKFLLQFIKNKTFVTFGVYRIVVAILLFLGVF